MQFDWWMIVNLVLILGTIAVLSYVLLRRLAAFQRAVGQYREYNEQWFAQLERDLQDLKDDILIIRTAIVEKGLVDEEDLAEIRHRVVEVPKIRREAEMKGDDEQKLNIPGNKTYH